MDEEEEEEVAATAKATPISETNESSEDAALDASFMSESIYQKLPTTSPRGRKVRSISALHPTSCGLKGKLIMVYREKIYAYST